MKRLISTAALAVGLFAQTVPAGKVLVTPTGKTFHSQRCMALSRSKQVYTVDRSAAEAHGLKPCGVCFRAKSAKKTDRSAWMKGGK